MSNTVCCFHFSIVNQGKNISEAPKELENQPCRKFESCMIGKTGVWYLRKNLVLFWPPDMQKTQEFPGFFGVVSFLFYPSGFAEQKRYRCSMIQDWPEITALLVRGNGYMHCHRNGNQIILALHRTVASTDRNNHDIRMRFYTKDIQYGRVGFYICHEYPYLQHRFP